MFTTLNVQHLESLNDVVGGITGITVWETVPDTFFDNADEVMLVDIPADDLLARLKAGKVYVPEQIERASRNFFRKGNLMALRELALRRTADRVEDDVQAYREDKAIGRVWKTEASLLCCVGPDPRGDDVVRSAARLATQLGVEWTAVYVETPNLQRLSARRNANGSCGRSSSPRSSARRRRFFPGRTRPRSSSTTRVRTTARRSSSGAAPAAALCPGPSAWRSAWQRSRPTSI